MPTRHWPDTIRRLLQLALDAIRPDASAREIGNTFGPGYDPAGRGEQWQIDRSNLPGVLNICFASDPQNDNPAVVSVLFLENDRPTLSEFEAALGEGTVAPKFGHEPWVIAFDGPVGTHARAALFLTTDAVTGDEVDPGITEFVIRRDPR